MMIVKTADTCNLEFDKLNDFRGPPGLEIS